MCLNCLFENRRLFALSEPPPLLANLSDIIEGNYYRAIEIKSIWDEIWDSFFNFSDGSLLSGEVLYNSLCQMGIVVAVLSTIWIFFDLYDKNKNGNFANAHILLSSLIVPAFVILMLSNNGRLIAATTYNIRGLINSFNTQILDNTFNYVNLSESMRALQSAMVLDSAISNEIKACDGLSGTQQTACLLEAKKNVDSELEKYKSAIGDRKFKDYISSIVTDNVFAQISNTAGYAVSNGGLGIPLLNLIPTWEEIFFSITSTVMVAYQHSLELALVGSSWVAPIVLGATCFPGPVAERAIFAWLSSIFSVGMAKVFFNLAAGFAAHVALEAISIDAGFFKLPMYVFICLFAPVISAGLAAGGGIALYRAGTSAVAGATSGLGNIATIFM